MWLVRAEYVLIDGDSSQWGGERLVVALVWHKGEILHQELDDLLGACDKLGLAVHRAATIYPASRHLDAREDVAPELVPHLPHVDHRQERAFGVLAQVVQGGPRCLRRDAGRVLGHQNWGHRGRSRQHRRRVQVRPLLVRAVDDRCLPGPCSKGRIRRA